MKIIRLIVGNFFTNCYLLVEGNNTIIIDPGADADNILKIINKMKLNVQNYLLTHSHYDHFSALKDLLEIVKAPIMIGNSDAQSLLNPAENLSLLMADLQSIKADILLKDNDIIRIGENELKVIHTPGHTRGSICLLGDDFILTGDTLFYGGYGRTDLPGGSEEHLICSLKKLLQLPDNLKVYPGHGEYTTIGNEKISNSIF